MSSTPSRPRDACTGACISADEMYPAASSPTCASAAGTLSSSTASPSLRPSKKRRVEGEEAASPTALNDVVPMVLSSESLSLQPYSSASARIFAALSEDLLVSVCEHFTPRELARLDRVCKVFRALLNLPAAVPSSNTILSSLTSSSSCSSSSDPSTAAAASSSSSSPDAPTNSAAYIWRNAALSPSAWPFPKRIDREHMERTVLKHLRSQWDHRTSLFVETVAFLCCRSFYCYVSSLCLDLPPRSFSSAHVLDHGASLSASPSFDGAAASSTAIVGGSPTAIPVETTTMHRTVTERPDLLADLSGNSAAAAPIDSPHQTPILHHSTLSARQSALQMNPQPLDWKSILASVEARRAVLGTGTLVLDMGSCTVSVGMGGVDAGPHGHKSTLPLSFPAIALNDLVGDQIGSDSVKSINPVSSISMPILHANETGEFSYCSPIWKYAMSRVEEAMFCGKTGQNTAAAAAAASASSVAAPSAATQTFSTSTAAPMDLSAASLASIQQAFQHANANAAAANSAPGASSAASAASSDLGGGTILVCDQLLGSKMELAKKRAKVARILFSLQPPQSKLKLAFCNESFLSLLNAGKTTGVVLHVGFSRTTCAIFVHGRVQNLSSLPTRMVGGHIHSRIMLQALFSRRQFQPAVADMFAVIPMLKEQCYCALDTTEEQQKPREVTHVEVSIADKKLTLGHERFTSSDVFFLYGFPAMVVEALQSSPAWPVLQRPVVSAPVTASSTAASGQQQQLNAIPRAELRRMENEIMAESATTTQPQQEQVHGEEEKSDAVMSDNAAAASSSSSSGSVENEEDEPHQLIKTLLQSIVLSGRSTHLTGFAARFERDLNAILKQNTPARVHENDVECSWLGGSVLASLSIFDALTITRDEFAQDGLNAVLRHMEI
jgi:hypothetical protein